MSAANDDVLLLQDACRDAYFGLGAAASWLGNPEEARTWQALALDASEAIGHHALVGYVQCQVLQLLLVYQPEQLAERRRVAAATITSAERVGGTWGGYSTNAFALPLDMLEGRWGGACAIARRTCGDHSVPALDIRRWVHGALALERGDEDLAAALEADLQTMLPDGPATEPGQCDFAYALTLQRLAAAVALAAGDREQAHAWIAAHDRWLAWSGAVLGRAEGQLLWARYQRLAGDLDRARHHAARALEHASHPRQPLALIAAHRLLGQIETRRERFPDAEEQLRQSLALATTCAAPYEQALTLLALAELWLAAGKQEAVEPVLDQARELCTPLEAKPALARIAELASRLADRASMPPSYPGGLTCREAEVLGLLAAGRSNREMAVELFLSVRTVERHITNIYAKIGARSRAEATAYAFRNDLVDSAST